MRYRFVLTVLLLLIALLSSDRGFADDSEPDDLTNTIRSSTSASSEIGRSGYDFGSTLTFETSGTVVTDAPLVAASAYTLQPTLKLGTWDLEASATFCYNQSLTPDPSTNLVPAGSFDNHVVVIAKKWGGFAFGVMGAIPANQAAREITYKGSFGPSAKATVELDRMTFSETITYQHRSFEQALDSDGIFRNADALKSLFEVGYQMSDALTISSSSLAVFTVAPDHSDYGIRSQLSLDYRTPLDFTASGGVAIERGLSTLEGVAGKTDLAQAFIDVIVEL